MPSTTTLIDTLPLCAQRLQLLGGLVSRVSCVAACPDSPPQLNALRVFSTRSYASSALAGQSFLRNLLAGAFPFFTTQMYENLTPHYASTLFGCLAAVLAVVPFIAFRWGPQIRARSPMSRKLLQEEERMRLFREEQAAKLTGQKSRVSQTV